MGAGRAAWVTLLSVLLLAPLAALRADTEQEEARRQLEQLQRDISRINREIGRARSERDALQEQLRETELTLNRLQRQLTLNRSRIASSEQKLRDLEAEQTKLQALRDAQQARVTTELRTAWQVGSQGQLKVLLSQESPHTVARALAYYRYFFEARNRQIEAYRATLASLQLVVNEIAATVATIEHDTALLQQQEAEARQAQETRAQAVAALNASIASKADQLKKMEADRQRLEELLAAIEEAVEDLQVPDSYQAFTDARGSMPWPVAGSHSNRYGQSRNQGDLRWQGIVIPAKEGTTVKAIHNGRVVYADWFRGYGLLLIVDHGEGFMSLYAHNQTLLREVGEWVTTGTAISTVGSSGGRTRAALYFEIRQGGKPVNPGVWCQGRG